MSKRIVRSRWRSVEADWHQQIPLAAGVYVVILDGRVWYVGSSESLRNRVRTYGIFRLHRGGFRTPWGDFQTGEIRYSLSRCRGDWLMREYRLIHRLQPEGNTRGVRRRKVLT